MKRLKETLKDYHPQEEVEIIDRWNDSHYIECRDAIAVYGDYFVLSEADDTKSFKLA